MLEIAAFTALFLFVVVIGFLAIGGTNEREDWCKARDMESVGGGHSPVLCYDAKTRLVYKPE